MKTFFTACCLAFALLSCNKKQLCNETELSVPGNIQSITGPDTLSAGQTIALIITVHNPDSICTKRAEGYVAEVLNNYAQIGAALICGTRQDGNCDCTHEQTIKTLVYFTPKDKGRYLFGIKKPASGIDNTTPKPLYEVFVQ